MAHNLNCAKAKGHVCRCGGCGGSEHGWRGWLGLAKSTSSERQAHREMIEAQWKDHYRPTRKPPNTKSRAAGTDLARLEIADWLASQGPTTATSGDKPNGALEIPRPRPPETGHIELVIDSEPQGSTQLPSLPDAVPSYQGEAECQPEPPDVHEPNDTHPYPTPVEQVEIFAEAMTASVWAEIAASIGDDNGKAREIKRQLANHGWCDLFIGLVQVIETSQKLLAEIPDSAKLIVKQAIRNSSMKNGRSYVTDAVVDIVVDRVWSAFKGVIFAHYPLMKAITNEDAARSLRILAVFICPAPEDHQEVREHALKPLGDDVGKILTEKTKQRLAKLFDEWTADAGEPGLAAPRPPTGPDLRAVPNPERTK